MQPANPSAQAGPPAPRIRRLDDVLINQIAAGEVVERPASIVKELVENSLDAAASRIDVCLQDGGVRELVIVDDGHGMGPDDLLLSVERHATSKIQNGADLERLMTFGFRGEALASIASVAEVEVRSRPPGLPSAFRITVAYGSLSGGPEPTAGAVGTAVTVRSLFARLPARAKFLRAPATEFAHAARTFRELALSSPGVRFSLQHQGRKIAQYVAPTRAARFAEVCRHDWEPLEIREEGDGATLEAWLSPPSVVQDRGELFLFVNGRIVKNRGLLAAVRNAYAGVLGPGHDPSGVVFLDLRPEWVDANVHPQKLEIRCLRQENWYAWMQAAVRKALASSAPRAQPGAPARTAVPFARDVVQPPMAGAWPVVPRVAPGADFAPAPVAMAELWHPPATAGVVPETTTEPAHGMSAAEAPGRSFGGEPALRFVGALGDRYWLAQDARGLVILDAKALAVRVRQQQWTERYDRGELAQQRLLVPRVIALPAELLPVLAERGPELGRLGFEVEPFGDGEAVVKARPADLPDELLDGTVVRALRAWLEVDSGDPDAPRRVAAAVLGELARVQARSLGDVLCRAEAERLAAHADIDEWSEAPDGARLAMRVGYAELEKFFGKDTKQP